MSAVLDQGVKESRALRDAALALVQADIAHLKGDFSGKSVGSRIADRLSEGAVDVFEEAVEVADDNKGVLITLLAAVAVWFARNPILDLFSDSGADNEEHDDESRLSADHEQA
ncbi:MAG: hypothetical protein WAT93_04955 [Pontixanthobacter sp.]